MSKIRILLGIAVGKSIQGQKEELSMESVPMQIVLGLNYVSEPEGAKQIPVEIGILRILPLLLRLH